MGTILTREKNNNNNNNKKQHVSYIFMRKPYVKFKNPSIHCSKVMLCSTKHAMYKCQKITKGHNTLSIFLQKLIRSSTYHSQCTHQLSRL